MTKTLNAFLQSCQHLLGSGEVIGKLPMLWDELLNHGDGPFVLDISFSPVRSVHPSLTLKAVIVQSLVDCEITQLTDAGHAQFVEYTVSVTVSLPCVWWCALETGTD
ncbi:hypothetical protein EDD22DRAFT_841970 [Suillus occidentalis]|nr:hypothetical protein EDD22DRAFT_841970 [Suillus occidentalis]